MNLGFPEMLFLFLLALLLFGPKKLPEIGRQIGRGLAEFKRASNELKGQLENEMRLLEAEDREKKISPPPENTVAASTETASTPAEPAPLAAVATAAPADAAPQISTPPIAVHQQAGTAVADSDPPPSPGPGVEGA